MIDKESFFIGALVGATILILILLSPWSYHSMAVKAISECEKTLPRDQECMLVGIPKPKE